MTNVERAPLSHAQILEYLPAYVLGALDPDEMLAVDDYLQAHPELLSRVAELEALSAQLAYAAPPAPLPPELRDEVVARARASLPPGRAHPAATPPPSRLPSQLTWSEQVAAWWRQRGLFDVTLVGTALTTLLLTVALGRTILQLDRLQSHISELQSQVATVQADNELLRNENLRLQSEIEMHQNQLASLAAATEFVALSGTESAPTASGVVYVTETQATLILRNLEELGAAQIYQLWLIPAEGAPISAGLLGSAGGALQTVSVALPADVAGFAAVGISVEPSGGSAAPTGPIVLVGPTT
jgi:anti-sigma-K factor RskA